MTLLPTGIVSSVNEPRISTSAWLTLWRLARRSWLPVIVNRPVPVAWSTHQPWLATPWCVVHAPPTSAFPQPASTARLRLSKLSLAYVFSGGGPLPRVPTVPEPIVPEPIAPPGTPPPPPPPALAPSYVHPGG